MHGLTIVKSLLVRVFLLAHGLICAWRVVDTNDNQYCWVILVGLGFLLVETGIVIWLRNGHEFKTVAFCIIFYLTCAIPALWMIHIETANRKLFHLAETHLNSRAATYPLSRSSNGNSSRHSHSTVPQLVATTTPLILSIGNIECHDKAWYYMEEQRWLDAIQETLFVVLSLCRLILSREHFTVEKGGIILIITFINSADLLSISNLLQYHDVIIDRLWMYMGLVLLSIGLLQLSIIDTDGLTHIYTRPSIQKSSKRRFTRRIHFLQDQSLYSLFRALFLQDGLFLVYRILIATKVRCSKPALIFYMSKNVLIIALHCYRVYHRAKENDRKKTLTAYEHLLNTTLSRKYRHPLYDLDRGHLTRQEEKLLHRTLRRPTSIGHRRTARSSRQNFPHSSISYPFARRRNDGGRARTAFALYGLPFRTPPNPRPATISSTTSLIAKAFVH